MYQPNIILTGFMGTGKTTVGKLLAERLRYQFVDTDELIVLRHGRSIADIFAEEGEASFRQMEREAAAELAQKRGCVISTGGRLMLDEENQARLGGSGLVFCLTASPETIVKRVMADEGGEKRPLLQGNNPAENIRLLLSRRQPIYANFPQIETEGKSPEQVVNQLLLGMQIKLSQQVVRHDDLGEVHHVAGVDVGFEDGGETTRAAVVVLKYPALTVVETAVAHLPTTMPYVPGMLSFREIPALLEALQKIQMPIDLILCDGQGIAHPRRLGLASHLGLLAQLPTIGVAKTRFIGTHAPVGETKGSVAPLMDKGEQIGVVLRTRDHVKPLFISVGHRVGLDTAVSYVLHCTPKYRLPETTRQAHNLASNVKRRGDSGVTE